MRTVIILLSLIFSLDLSAQGEYYYQAPTMDTASGTSWTPWIYVNLNRFGTAQGSPWNNQAAASNSTGAKGTNLLNSVDVATTVDLNMIVATSEQFITTPGSTGSETGVWPDKVLGRGWGSTSSFTFEIQQLAASTDYKIEFFASLQSYWGNTNVYTVQGVEYIYTGLADNHTILLSVETTSNGSGVITIEVEPGAGVTYGNLNGFVIYNQ